MRSVQGTSPAPHLGNRALSLRIQRIATRPSPARFGQMELFWQTEQMDLLRELAEHALAREFTEIDRTDEPLSTKLLRMYREICRRQAVLVAHWLRVGYCQVSAVPVIEGTVSDPSNHLAVNTMCWPI